MNIKIDWSKVIEVEPYIESDNIYMVSVAFNDGQVMTYAYNNQQDFIKAYTKIMHEWR